MKSTISRYEVDLAMYFDEQNYDKINIGKL